MTVGLVNLHEKKSKYDTMYKGKTVRFFIESDSNGILAKFALEQKMIDMLPPELKGLIEGMGAVNSDQTTFKTLIRKKFSPKWYDSFLKTSMTKRVEKWAIKQKSLVEEFVKKESLADTIRSELG